MDFYEREWDILFSRFADAVGEEKRRLGINGRYIKGNAALEDLALIYPSEKKDLELVPSIGSVFAKSDVADALMAFLENYRQTQPSLRYNYFTLLDLAMIERQLRKAFDNPAELRLSYPKARSCSKSLYGYLNDTLKEVSSVTFSKSLQIEMFLLREDFFKIDEEKNIIGFNEEYLTPFVCIESSPDEKPTYLITENGLRVIAEKIFGYYCELFASSPFSSAMRFSRSDFVRTSADISNLIWCSKSYFICRSNGKCYRLDGGCTKKEKDEVLNGSKLFYLRDGETKSIQDDDRFYTEHDVFREKYSPILEDTNRKIFLSNFAKSPVGGVYEVFPIPNLHNGDNTFSVFIPSEYSSEKTVLPYLIGWNVFLDPVTTDNGYITITWGNRPLPLYTPTRIEYKFYNPLLLKDMYAIADEENNWQWGEVTQVPWHELTELFDKHRSVSDYLFANRDRIVEYDWAYTNPNYHNPVSRIGYWYTYTCKYVYEYVKLYLSVLGNDMPSIFSERKELRVLSVGCGQNADYIALRHALLLTRQSRTAVVYRGLDAQNWDEYLPAGLANLTLPFLETDTEAGSELRLGTNGRIENYVSELASRNEKIDADVIIFPTSYLDVVQTCGYDDRKVSSLWNSILSLINGPTLLVITTIYNERTAPAIDKAIATLENILRTATVEYSRVVSSDDVQDERLCLFRSAYQLYRVGLKDNIETVINNANRTDPGVNVIHRMPNLEGEGIIKFKSFLYMLNSREEEEGWF